MTLDIHAPWDQQPLVCIDFETTGPDPLTCAPVQVAAVRFERGGKESSSFEALLNPGCPISPEATAIHHITDEMVAASRTLVDHRAMLAKVCNGAVPVAYNASFDRTILHRYLTDESVPAFDPAQLWICPLTIVRDVDRFERGAGRHKLVTACQRRLVCLDDAHNALSDARATGLLLLYMLDRGDVKSCPLGKLLAHIEKRRLHQDADFAAWLAKQPKREGVPA